MTRVDFRQILEKISFINFHDNPSIRAEFLHNDRRTDRLDEADSQFS